MHSRLTASEYLMGELACRHFGNNPTPKILIGGLGLGYTLKAVLEHMPKDGRIDMFELIPEVVEWNHSFMHQLNGSLLDDPRVHVNIADAFDGLKIKGRYDAIVMDIDNGPLAMVANSNGKVYRKSGISKLYASLRKKGRVAVWSAQVDSGFEKNMKTGGFKVEVVPAKTHENARSYTYQIYLGDK